MTTEEKREQTIQSLADMLRISPFHAVKAMLQLSQATVQRIVCVTSTASRLSSSSTVQGRNLQRVTLLTLCRFEPRNRPCRFYKDDSRLKEFH